MTLGSIPQSAVRSPGSGGGLTVARPRGTGRPGRGSYRSRGQRLTGAGFVLPAAILFLLFAVYPMVRVIYLSFFHYQLLGTPSFAGLDNYRYIWHDPVARSTVLNTVEYVIGTYVPTIVLALLVAMALNNRMRGSGLVRLIYFLPVAMSWVVVAVIWNLVFQPQGLLNQLTHLQLPWLTSSRWAPIALMLVSIWKELGFFVILFLAGLQRIPRELYDAASTDGASAMQKFRYVTLPELRSMLLVVTVLAVYRGLAVFSPQYVLTSGGPANSTEVANLYVYNTAFVYGDMGRAAAMSVLLFVVLLVAGAAQFITYRRSGGE